jgi:hypothetical protein
VYGVSSQKRVLLPAKIWRQYVPVDMHTGVLAPLDEDPARTTGYKDDTR